MAVAKNKQENATGLMICVSEVTSHLPQDNIVCVPLSSSECDVLNMDTITLGYSFGPMLIHPKSISKECKDPRKLNLFMNVVV